MTTNTKPAKAPTNKAQPKAAPTAKKPQQVGDAQNNNQPTSDASILALILLIAIGIGVWYIGKAVVTAAGNLFVSAEEKCLRDGKIWYDSACLSEDETYKALAQKYGVTTTQPDTNQKPTESTPEPEQKPTETQPTPEENPSSNKQDNNSSSSTPTPTGPTASEIKDRIITRCTYEYGQTLGANAKAECEDEYKYITSSEANKIYQLIQSGTSYSDALRQI